MIPWLRFWPTWAASGAAALAAAALSRRSGPAWIGLPVALGVGFLAEHGGLVVVWPALMRASS